MADDPARDALWASGWCLMAPSDVTRFVGRRIAALRTDAGLSQRELAKALGVSQASLARWELGEREPTLSHLVAIANWFQVPLSTLLPH